MQKITRIELEKLKNTRDLGGFKTMDSRVIKKCRLLRSGELYHASASDLKTLVNQYNLKTVVDFRTATEKAGKPDPHIKGVRYITNPIVEEDTLGITREKEQKKDGLKMLMEFVSAEDFSIEAYMAGVYSSIIHDAYSVSQYRRFFDILLAQEEGAVLWHCSAGKDRVGVGTALLLSALGVDRATIIADYMKVNDYVGKDNEKLVRGMLGDRADKLLEERLMGMFSVDERYICTVFDEIDQQYGGMESYLKDMLGLDEEKIARLRSLYLEPITAAVFFSPTGTSKKGVQAMAGCFPGAIADIDLTVPAGIPEKTELYSQDFAVFGAPVYSGRLYKGCIDRFKTVMGHKTPCIVTVTYGNRDYEDALLELSELVKARGFIPVAAAALIGQHTYGEIQIGRPDKEDLLQDIAFASEVIKAVENGGIYRAVKVPGNYPYREGGNGHLVHIATKADCTECGLCAAQCPVGAISAENAACIDETRCIGCFRCIQLCPAGAKLPEDAAYTEFAAALTKRLEARKENAYFL